MPPQRKLAAIMFSDISGYTAMMQRNESDGMLRARRYRQVLEEKVAEHGGEVLQHYGDGSLCIFASAVEAVNCAIQIQKALTQPPEVPLRIGIHLGDIVVDGQDIFGDGVNVTARVQTLAVPGGILLTERLLPEVRNHPDFRTQSLGRFHFKNVDLPLEVFALTNNGLPVPTPREIQLRLDNAAATPEAKLRSSTGRSNRWLVWAGLGALALLGLMALVWALLPTDQPRYGALPQAAVSDPTAQSTIAVLPFENLSADSNQTYLADGIAEEVISSLAQVPGLRVAGRTSSFSFRDRQVDIREIGRQLGVDLVLEGSVRRAGKQLRITAQLSDTESGYQRWSQSYDRELDDIFAIQEEIADAVVQQLKGTLAGETRTGRADAGARNSQAYDWYLRGRYMLSQRADGAQQAVEFFERAIASDSTFAMAYAGLGHAYLWLAWGYFLPSSQSFPLARRYAEKALELDGSLAYARAVLGSVYLWYDWDWEAAQRELEAAIAGNPSEGAAYLDLGWRYAIAGDFDQAIAYDERALALDPLHLEYNVDLADHYRLARRYDQALRIALSMRDLYPSNSDSHWILGMVYYNQGDYARAEEAFRQSLRLSGDQPWASLHLLMAQSRTDRRAEAQQAFAEMRGRQQLSDIAPVEYAMTALALGDRDLALQLLEKAYDIRANWMISIKVDPVWDDLREDARFQALVRKMDFPD